MTLKHVIDTAQKLLEEYGNIYNLIKDSFMCGKNYLCENNNDMPVLVVFLTCINEKG